MIGCEKVQPKVGDTGEAFTVSFITSKRHGTQRFGGEHARAEATNFAVEILEELLDNPPL